MREPPPGRLVNGLHVRDLGAGAPAVVFEAGIAGSGSSWDAVQRALTTFRTVSYDRPGLGWSPESSSNDRSLKKASDDLRSLLIALDVPRPIVLVAHSYGAYIATVFANRFSDDVRGIVLVDPLTPDEWIDPGWRGQWRLGRAVTLARIASGLARVGLVRLGLWGLLRRGHGNPGPILGLSPTLRRMAIEVSKLPPEIARGLQSCWSQPGFFRTMAAAIATLPACASEAAAHPIPASMPVTVLSGAHQPPDLLAKQAALGTRHVIVAGGHWIHLDRADAVCEAISETSESTSRRG